MCKDILIDLPIPFYTQKVNNYKEEGFKSEEDAKYWETSGCGIASVRMIIDGFRIKSKKSKCMRQGEMIYLGLEKGAYCDIGWIHSGLVEIAKEYDVIGITHRNSSIDCIEKDILDNKPCMISASPRFDNDGSQPKGGHLVVALGIRYEEEKLQGFIINHPSSKDETSWERKYISLQDFINSFSGNYISFTSI